MSPGNSPSYERRFVAFVDILGFSQLVQRTVTDHGLFERVYAVLRDSRDQNLFRELFHDGNWPSNYQNTQEFGVVFSDSVVHTTQFDARGLIGMMFELNRLTLSLLQNGFFVRGGLVVGDIFVDRNIVFGPGLIEAYELESSHAVYPRILVSDSVINAIAATEGSWMDDERAIYATWPDRLRGSIRMAGPT
jgi:hypothetical protein